MRRRVRAVTRTPARSASACRGADCGERTRRDFFRGALDAAIHALADTIPFLLEDAAEIVGQLREILAQRRHVVAQIDRAIATVTSFVCMCHFLHSTMQLRAAPMN
ncbi:MAG: hypothetical protein IPG56_12850 [Caulobacteraceae bacterium]|nr:hypothetical protein [Caulobacteraceae bacterium]